MEKISTDQTVLASLKRKLFLSLILLTGLHRQNQIRLYCMRCLIWSYTKIFFIKSETSKSCWDKTGCTQAVLSLKMLSWGKATFDLSDSRTAPGVLQWQCIQTCYTNRLIIRQPSLKIRVKLIACLPQKGQWDVDLMTITKTCLFKYTEKLTTKKWKYSSYFCSKHRLWVLVRTALARRF